MKKPLIILTGPTAVGKTELSIKLAKAVNGEIVSADSMQVYKEMDIGTAKITNEEMQESHITLLISLNLKMNLMYFFLKNMPVEQWKKFMKEDIYL